MLYKKLPKLFVTATLFCNILAASASDSSKENPSLTRDKKPMVVVIGPEGVHSKEVISLLGYTVGDDHGATSPPKACQCTLYGNSHLPYCFCQTPGWLCEKCKELKRREQNWEEDVCQTLPPHPIKGILLIIKAKHVQSKFRSLLASVITFLKEQGVTDFTNLKGCLHVIITEATNIDKNVLWGRLFHISHQNLKKIFFVCPLRSQLKTARNHSIFLLAS